MKYLILFIILLSCRYYDANENEVLKIKPIPGKCFERVTIHWKHVAESKQYKIFWGCASCLPKHLYTDKCVPGLHHRETIKNNSWTMSTVPPSCASYQFAVKSLKDGLESDLSNIQTCNIYVTDPDFPSPPPLQTRSWESYQGTEFRTDELDVNLRWDCSQYAVNYNMQTVKIDDTSHPTVYLLGSTSTCNVPTPVTLPAVLGHHRLQVNACDQWGRCSAWSDSDDPTSSQVCINGTCLSGAWQIHIRLSPPVIIME